MFVAGVDGCRAGWVWFKIEVPSLTSSVQVVDLVSILRNRPRYLAQLGIDIPIGLLDGSRECDKAARRLLGRPRGSSVFPAPCRAALLASTHSVANFLNRQSTTRGLSQQAWGIVPKIKQVDDAMTQDCQEWVSEVHPEVCFWGLNSGHPMRYRKKSKEGAAERLSLLAPMFPSIHRHITERPPQVGVDDLLDAAVAAWSALRRYKGEAKRVCTPERDEKGLSVAIYY